LVLTELIAQCWDGEPSNRPTFASIVERLQKLKADGPERVHLTVENATVFHKAATIWAYRSKDPVTILKDWGKNSGKAGCFVCLSGDDDVYLCAEDVFASSCTLIPNTLHEYRKSGFILGKRMDQQFANKTNYGMEHGSAGDFLVQNEAGDQWVIEAHIFHTIYEEDR